MSDAFCDDGSSTVFFFAKSSEYSPANETDQLLGCLEVSGRGERLTLIAVHAGIVRVVPLRFGNGPLLLPLLPVLRVGRVGRWILLPSLAVVPVFAEDLLNDRRDAEEAETQSQEISASRLEGGQLGEESRD